MKKKEQKSKNSQEETISKTHKEPFYVENIEKDKEFSFMRLFPAITGGQDWVK